MIEKPRVLVIHPGHMTATPDVAVGLGHGFEALGYEIESFLLGHRASGYQEMLLKDGKIPKEKTVEFALGMASEEITNRIIRAQPEVVLIICGALIHPHVWPCLGYLAHDFPIHLVLTECPYEDEKAHTFEPFVTYVWANDKISADREGWGYLPAAYDPVTHHPPTGPVEGCPDVLFVGTGWQERIEFFGAADWTGIDFKIMGPADSWPLAHGTPIEKYLEHSAIPGAALWPYYAGSGAIVNLHRQSRQLDDPRKVTGAYSLNPRCYQVPACGGLLLSDWRPEWDEVFGSVLPTFDSPAELVKLARYYLDNPGARQDAVFASMEAVKPHSYTARAKRILEEVHR